MKDKVNEIQISYTERIPSPFWQKINSSKDAAALLFQHWDKSTIQVHESFKVMLLNNSNKVKGIYHLSKGGTTGTLVDIRILFAVYIPYFKHFVGIFFLCRRILTFIVIFRIICTDFQITDRWIPGIVDLQA
ncbi:JAB domain-containing protein [uncultured Maribacter sp.]|uniref:JAB domain-containing protein n=1 Tax=uncultured Maribacter sp. TaxID=431308 RepID=UPI0030EC4B5B|tara:strand:+ start:8350 stop:8745 length:396 start_codon:yes stop_codon:yes gene_type:complete